MRLALVAVGQAGGKIADAFLEYDERTGENVVRFATAVNTAKADLKGVTNVPERRRVLIGQSRVKGHGVGADNELGAEIAEEDIDEVRGAIDAVPVHEIDAFLVVAGLGGGTGSGGAPVIARHLDRIYTEPVYGLGVLPGADEGGIYTLNAARSLQTFVDEVDNLLVFDNDAWRQTGESVRGDYERINEEIVRRLGTLFAAGEVTAGAEIAESVVDSSEIINTLSGGGISTVGYAEESVQVPTSGGFFAKLRGERADVDLDAIETTNRITSLVRKATLGRLTLPCEIEGAERALLLTAGPSPYLDRKGIERGRKWLEERTGSMEVRGGDYPSSNRGSVAATVVLSGVTSVPRVKELQRVAIEAKENIAAIAEESASNRRNLVESDGEELKPLF